MSYLEALIKGLRETTLFHSGSSETSKSNLGGVSLEQERKASEIWTVGIKRGKEV